MATSTQTTFRPFYGKVPVLKIRPVSAKLSTAAATLVRINKKANVPDITQTTEYLDDVRTVRPVNLYNPNMKKVLGELYTDIRYLHQLKQNVDKESKVITDLNIGTLAETGVRFLQNRTEFWDNLGPLPPVVMKKKPKYQSNFKGSIASINTEMSRSTRRSNTSLYSREKKKEEKAPESVIQFEFKTYQPSPRLPPPPIRADRLTVKIEDNSKISSDNQLSLNGDDLANAQKERNIQVEQYFKKALQDIQKDFEKEYFESCEERIEECLQCLKNIHSDILEKKVEYEVKLYNIKGDLMFKLGYCEKAVDNYQKALEGSGTLRELRLYILGNISRVFTHKGEYSKSLEMLTEQSRITRSDGEVAMVFLNLGQCFLSLKQYESANDCGTKSLAASKRCKSLKYQIESLVLLAIALARLNKPQHALKKLSRAKSTLNKIGTRFLHNLIQSAETMVNAINKYNHQSSQYRKQKGSAMFPQITSHNDASSFKTKDS
ncbi:hypothetical protein LOTGIDRAFT_164507 [Lottia gigantea]|uniref:Outer dynein arm-docking complex subunit 4 n=1 Tax=Lottia gigantea TaxID=225164 RepID=V4AA52_LOTGI|nr:hypothetical protein LOTGIDRAFT_164507 [Lottia gigantea]ESO90191.1 hypothetical protein LOTGIDRAFT_164507 [Lottia gigantea]